MDPCVRLYLDDPYRLEFEAEILERRSLANGDLALVLDRTCFYPTSGGQPHDVGWFDSEPVLEVQEAEDGAVVHRVQHDVKGPQVRGRVDGTRRRDHMQQHSGQHLLSATCIALFGRETLSFHLGAERCTIDLPGAAFESAQLVAIELGANKIVWEGREVSAHILAPGEARRLRKPPPADAGEVRVVEIAGWDASPCCGTHVRHTSEIGLVKLLAQERIGGGTRLHFVCGFRALAACQTMQDRVDALVRLLTCHPDELVARFERLAQELKGLRTENETLQAEIAAAQSVAWLANASHAGGVPLVVAELEPGSPAALRSAATVLVEQGAVALLGQRGERVQLLFARPDAVVIDLRPAMQAACALVEGKGGGPPARVQGAGSRGEALSAALEAARAEVSARLSSLESF
jgi:alanyl-tRNA synthetase